jgi:hypothetical protein
VSVLISVIAGLIFGEGVQNVRGGEDGVPADTRLVDRGDGRLSMSDLLQRDRGTTTDNRPGLGGDAHRVVRACSSDLNSRTKARS